MYDAFISVDLGRQHDYTAIIVAEEARWIGDPPDLGRFGPPTPVEWPPTMRGWVAPSELLPVQRQLFASLNYQGERPDRPPLLVRHIERVRGRPYPQIVDEIVDLLRRPPLAELSVALLVDAGGVGVAVLDLMRSAGLRPYAITATAGDRVNAPTVEDARCPKRELVAAAQIVLAEGRLRIASGLEHAPTLVNELTDYRVAISQAGHDSYSARTGAHDDLVFAAAMLCWFRDWFSIAFDDQIRATRREQFA